MSENPSSPFRMLRWAGVVVCFAAVSGPLARGAAAPPPPSAQETTPDNLTASGLISQGRAAFEASDFEKAEKLLDQLVADYGENPEVAPYVDEIRPLLAMCKVKRGDFEAAITLIGQSLKHPGLPAAAPAPWN